MSVLAVRVRSRLDAAGDFTVRVPLTDPRTAEAQVGRVWRHYREGEGFVFAGLIDKVRKVPDDLLEISGTTLIAELFLQNTGLGREYASVTANAIFDGLLRSGPWYRSGTFGALAGSMRFDGETVLAAIGREVKQFGMHFRENVTEVAGVLDRQIEVGAFGTVSGITLLASPHETQVIRDQSLAEVVSLEVLDSSEEVWNWVFPIGAGDSGGQQSLRLVYRGGAMPSRMVHRVLIGALPMYFIADDIFVYDNFHRPDAAHPGYAQSLHQWEYGPAGWDIINNACENTEAPPTESMLLLDCWEMVVPYHSTSPRGVEVTLAHCGDDGGIVLRFQDTTNVAILLRIRNVPNGLEIFQWTGPPPGAFVALGAWGGVCADGDVIRITNDVVNSINAYQNGVLRIGPVVRAVPYAGRSGLYENSAADKSRYTNFRVSDQIANADIGSAVTYGLRQRVASLKQTISVDTSKVELQAAAQALYDEAVEQLAAWVTPQRTYSVAVRGLLASVKPGDKVHLRWTGLARFHGEDYAYLEADDDLFVLERGREFYADGSEISRLVVSSISRVMPESDEGDISSMQRDVEAFARHAQMTGSAHMAGPIREPIVMGTPVVFNIRLEDDIVQLVRCILRLEPKGGASLSLWIDGANRTGALGGPWVATAYLDVTQYLLDADEVVVPGDHSFDIRTTVNGDFEAFFNWTVVPYTAAMSVVL